MKRLPLLALLFLYGATFAAAQAPDCIVFFSLTATGQTSPTSPNAGLNNLNTGCTTWNLSYSNSGFSALTLALQSAPNVGGAPGTWVTFSGGTLQQGINPNTATTAAFTWITGYQPWIRVALTAKTGTGIINGALYGYRIPLAGAATTTNLTQVGGSAITLGQKTMANSLPVVLPSDQTVNITASNVPVQGLAAVASTPQGNPVYLAGSGTALAPPGSVYAVTACDNSTAVSVTAGNTTQVVAISGSTAQIRVCSFALTISTGPTGTAKFVTGTGSNCAGGQSDLSGAWTLSTGVPVAVGSGLGELFHTPANQALCVSATTGTAAGLVTWARY